MARSTGIARKLAGVVFLAFAVAWSPGSSASIQFHALRHAEGYVGTYDAWVYASFPMSVECPEYLACYARSQWLRAYVYCPGPSIAVIERTVMDINGDVVFTTRADAVRFGPPGRDPAAVAVLHALCRVDDPERYREWRREVRQGRYGRNQGLE
jgi:hypothetical protein